MKTVWVLLFALLSFATRGQALKCYSCVSTKDIGGFSIAQNILNGLKAFPPCTDFDASNPDKKFEQTCPAYASLGCVKLTDPNDSSNVLRSCFLSNKNECKDNACYCNGDLCNSAGVGTPSALVLAAVVLISLLGWSR